MSEPGKELSGAGLLTPASPDYIVRIMNMVLATVWPDRMAVNGRSDNEILAGLIAAAGVVYGEAVGYGSVKEMPEEDLAAMLRQNFSIGASNGTRNAAEAAAAQLREDGQKPS